MLGDIKSAVRSSKCCNETDAIWDGLNLPQQRGTVVFLVFRGSRNSWNIEDGWLPIPLPVRCRSVKG